MNDETRLCYGFRKHEKRVRLEKVAVWVPVPQWKLVPFGCYRNKEECLRLMELLANRGDLCRN
jgi:hypothetical protein